MRIKAFVFTLFCAGLFLIPHRVCALDAGDLIDYFVNTLSPYGRWLDQAPYGRVWEPYVRDSNWRPYSAGRWVYTDDYGWVWQPADSFGEIPYRYGRWSQRAGRWFWVPDRVWSPAWVDWRYSDDYVGWAPLPPDDDWRVEDDRWRHEWRPSYYENRIEPSRYVVVPTRNFTAPDVRHYEVPVARNREVLRHARPITVYRRDDQNRVRNEGPRREAVERAAGHRIEPVRIEPKEARPRDSRAQAANRYREERSDEGRRDHRPSGSSQVIEQQRRQEQAMNQQRAAQQARRAQQQAQRLQQAQRGQRQEGMDQQARSQQARKGEPDRDARNRQDIERRLGPSNQNRQGHPPGAEGHARARTEGRTGGPDGAAKPGSHGHRDPAEAQGGHVPAETQRGGAAAAGGAPGQH